MKKKFYPINLIKMTKIETKIASVQNEMKSFIYNEDIILPPYPYLQVGMTQKEREEGASHTLLTVRFIIYQHHSLLLNIPL